MSDTPQTDTQHFTQAVMIDIDRIRGCCKSKTAGKSDSCRQCFLHVDHPLRLCFERVFTDIMSG